MPQETSVVNQYLAMGDQGKGPCL